MIVEGYTDVMACHLAGIETAIATCGTAFGGDHVKILRRLLMDNDTFGGQVVFTFDGDAAGQKAAMRAFEDDQRFVAQTFVAVEPNGLDPCELRQKHGDAAVVALVDKPVPLFEFAIRSVLAGHDLDQPAGRVAALACSSARGGADPRPVAAPRVRALARWMAGHGDQAGAGRRQPGEPCAQTAESTAGAGVTSGLRVRAETRRPCLRRFRAPTRTTAAWSVRGSC